MPTVDTRIAFAAVTAIFFMWGFLTALNDVLIPHLKAVFELNWTRTMLIQFTFFGAYFVMSVPAGWVVDKVGYKLGIVIGLVVAGCGALLFLPAAQIQWYYLFLGALFTLASGITLLQVSANPYVSLLGDPARAASRLNLAQALNSLGHTTAPWVGGMLILATAVLGAEQLAALSEQQQQAYQAAQAQSVQIPYLGLALTLFVLAAVVFVLRLPALTEATERAARRHHTFSEVLRIPHVRWGVVAIFVYVGAEVAIGSFLINYIAQADIGAMSEASAAKYVSFYWGGAMVGRFLGSALLLRVSARRLLALYAAIACVLLLVTVSSHGLVAMWSVIAIGLFNSIMFPTIFTLGIERLGPMTEKASSLLVMAIVGGAIVPLAQGVLADRIGVQAAFALPLLCYAYIIWYGLYGSRLAPEAPQT
ncbi:L-fucose:H+ symporter permease [Luteimonas sp. SX5]|uniref:L-fucose:H+ symporter permease n=2 Tax=Luteimonas galliterrae TaxID=2940486 RepID=A0ABT0MHD9_9GAMM|nr:L-fucose:H+ symporter permease [Luteimonas galliterrae]MCL1633715.1 L-fucose:H+ symporter permease [Luteimonas galliterrae]